jgi:hypothetical protein
MPSWLYLLLFVLGLIAICGLQAAAAMGKWSVFWRACRGLALYFGIPAAIGLFIFGWITLMR